MATSFLIDTALILETWKRKQSPGAIYFCIFLSGILLCPRGGRWSSSPSGVSGQVSGSIWPSSVRPSCLLHGWFLSSSTPHPERIPCHACQDCLAANQLEVIEGYAGILAEITPAGSAKAAYMQKICRAAELIGSHLAISRDYQNFDFMAPCWQPVREIVLKSARVLQNNAIALDVRTGDLEVFADPLFEKVFYTLFENAIRHGRGVTRVTVTFEETADLCILAIEDDGEGVADAIKGRIFDKNVGSHTGLGFFIAREVLLTTGISIRETGIPWKGARFEVCVPEDRYRFQG